MGVLVEPRRRHASFRHRHRIKFSFYLFLKKGKLHYISREEYTLVCKTKQVHLNLQEHPLFSSLLCIVIYFELRHKVGLSYNLCLSIGLTPWPKELVSSGRTNRIV